MSSIYCFSQILWCRSERAFPSSSCTHHSSSHQPKSFCFSPSRIHLSRSSFTISFRCPTVLDGRGMSVTVDVMSAPRTSLSSNKKPCAWSSRSTSGICLPPLPLRPWPDDTVLRDLLVQWVHLELGHGSGLPLFFPHPPHRLLPFHILLNLPPSHLPQAPARPQRPARATAHPTLAMGVPWWAKRPAVLLLTHRLKAQGTD